MQGSYGFFNAWQKESREKRVVDSLTCIGFAEDVQETNQGTWQSPNKTWEHKHLDREDL